MRCCTNHQAQALHRHTGQPNLSEHHVVEFARPSRVLVLSASLILYFMFSNRYVLAALVLPKSIIG